MAVTPDKQGIYTLHPRFNEDEYNKIKLLAFEEDLSVHMLIVQIVREYLRSVD